VGKIMDIKIILIGVRSNADRRAGVSLSRDRRPPIVSNGRGGSPSGPKFQAQRAVSGTMAASPQESDGSAIHPYHRVSMGAAAPIQPAIIS
jgi:hypothetical protein